MERLDLCLKEGAELRSSQIRLLTSPPSLCSGLRFPFNLICFIKLSSRLFYLLNIYAQGTEGSRLGTDLLGKRSWHWKVHDRTKTISPKDNSDRGRILAGGSYATAPSHRAVEGPKGQQHSHHSSSIIHA